MDVIFKYLFFFISAAYTRSRVLYLHQILSFNFLNNTISIIDGSICYILAMSALYQHPRLTPAVLPNQVLDYRRFEFKML